MCKPCAVSRSSSSSRSSNTFTLIPARVAKDKMTQRVNLSEAEAQRMMEQQERAAAATEQKEAMLRAFVSAEGRERLKRNEQVKPERAGAVETHIINACRAGKLIPPVSDDVVKELLVAAAGGGDTGKASTITVVRKKLDDDW
jgi:programmed cell death protein 5